MRIAFDYGMGPRLPGIRPPRPGEETTTEQVLVIRREKAAEAESRPASSTKTGLPIPGTDYELRASDEAGRRDAEVRAHEKSHLLNLGGAAASGVMLETRRGPDGESYAVGGAIKADLSPVPGDPRASLHKAQRVIRAALAPGNPSSADMRVAADAYRMAREARDEMRAEFRETEWFA